MSHDIEQLLARNRLISDQVGQHEIQIILHSLARALSKNSEGGAVVEFGCYIGTTSLFIRRYLNLVNPSCAFHVYDSFAGLPEKTSHDISPVGEQFVKGELKVSRKAFEEQFKKAGLQCPAIHKAWFDELTETDIPEKIIFAYLDGDYYDSIATSLKLITPKLQSHAVIVVDDYANLALPGAAKAVDEWLAMYSEWSLRVEDSLAIVST